MKPFAKLQHMKTLLIDDDEFVRDSLRLLFESKNCCLMAFESAEQGIKALKNENYDIIIADYKLPGMDGLEFCRRVQKTHPGSMKILLTAYGSPSIAAEAELIGIHEYIEKPFTTQVIEASLSRLIDHYTS